MEASIQLISRKGVQVLASLAIVYICGCFFHNAILHPLRSVPGPLLNRITTWPWAYHMFRGNLPWHVAFLHEHYGPIVRISPNEVSLLDVEAWKGVYGVRAGGGYLKKYDPFYRPAGGKAPCSIVTAPREEHHVLRKLLAPGFSDQAIREQGPTIGGYVDLLIRRLDERCDKGQRAVDVRDWYNFATFDIIGRLAFGEDFGCLDSSGYHPWVRLILHSIKGGGFLNALNSLGLRPLMIVIGRGAMRSRMQHREWTTEKLRRRIERGSEQPDLIGRLIDNKDEMNFDIHTLRVNSSALTIAGSETTATLLTGATYLLLKNPGTLAKLTEEVLGTFRCSAEITLTSVNNLAYMLACLNEALRVYPPAPSGLPRVVPAGGATIAGKYIPENTIVSVSQLAMQRSKQFFARPDEFCPERFLGDPAFANDRLDAMQPFSLGPRNCIGRSLAYAEMRLILARMIFHFEMELVDQKEDWMGKNKIYNLWYKPELRVYLKPREPVL